MLVSRYCHYVGETRQLDLDVTQEQLDEYARSLGNVQDIFPNLSADDREFLVSGLLPGEWEEIFGEEE